MFHPRTEWDSHHFHCPDVGACESPEDQDLPWSRQGKVSHLRECLVGRKSYLAGVQPWHFSRSAVMTGRSHASNESEEQICGVERVRGENEEKVVER